MRVRVATVEDVPECLVMGRAFFDESGFAGETAYDEESTRATMTHLISAQDGVLLVAESDGLIGMAAALAFPHYFNAASRAAQELFWWVAPRARGGAAGVRLLRGLEAWAAEVGCSTMTMVCLPSLTRSPAERIYERCGYRPSERSFIKRV